MEISDLDRALDGPGFAEPRPDGRSIIEVAAEVIGLAHWLPPEARSVGSLRWARWRRISRRCGDPFSGLCGNLVTALSGLRDALNAVSKVVADEAGHNSPLVRSLLNARVLGPCRTQIRSYLTDLPPTDLMSP
ncbi:hypothetical protein [Streptomyces anulatus]|uniref:hypothetical protein n=1 Tax=Streptomyces anulatus TaxID=1892 RepID=UPI0036B40C6D